MEGFSLFGPAHLLWLILCLSICVLSLLYIDKLEETKQQRICRVVAILTLLLHLLQSVWRIQNGSYGLYTLPLHICAISSYLVFIHDLFPHPVIGEILFCPGMAGAAAAILTPDWTGYAPFSLLSSTGFLAHAAIVLYILLALRVGRIRPSWRNCYRSICFLLAYAAILIPFNRHFHTNYGFLNQPVPGSALAWIADLFGYGWGYFLGYAGLVLLVMAACYALYAALRHIAWKTKKTERL